MKKVQGHKEGKFLIVVGEKVYKFACKDDVEKDAWVKALEEEIKKDKLGTNKKLENIYESKLKKKVIEDYYELPNINTEKLSIKSRIEETIKTENFFPEKIKSY